MKLLTRWQAWWVGGREEYKFHNDCILEPGDSIVILAPNGHRLEIQAPPGQHAKVHLAASWEYRDTEFVEEKE